MKDSVKTKEVVNIVIIFTILYECRCWRILDICEIVTVISRILPYKMQGLRKS